MSIGYLRAVKTNFVDETMPKPCGDIFTENHVAEPFSTNTEEGVASSAALFPASALEQHEVPMHFYIKRFPLQFNLI